MASNWKEFRLEEICESIFSGGTPLTTNPDYWGGNLNWLSSGETGNRFIRSTQKKITEKAVKESSTRLALVGDIVIASAGQGHTRGQASFCLVETYVNQSVVVVRANKEKVNSRFLFYNISNRYDDLRQISDSHSIRGSLTTRHLKDLTVELPDLKTQEFIASILASLDERIEIDQQNIQTLEDMGQAIFKEFGYRKKK
jgi:type I restriction enzyme S subunit